MSTNVTYVYCLIESARPPSMVRTPRGLPAATTSALLEIGPRLWAVVADVPLSEYGTGRLEERLRDINWVAGIAVAHEAVVERFASAKNAAVVPMKLFTMFSSRDRAISELAARRSAIDAVLKRIRGCREWGIRVTHAAPARAAGSRPAAPATGTAFLTAKKRARDEARDRRLRAAEAAERTFDSLARLARDAHRRAAPANATTPPLVDAAFLVSEGHQTRFRAAVKRAARICRDADASLVLTGPWPAYNFVETLPERT
jgi:Gas vesicle synthesis protein GvpL/GvpF